MRLWNSIMNNKQKDYQARAIIKQIAIEKTQEMFDLIKDNLEREFVDLNSAYIQENIIFWTNVSLSKALDKFLNETASKI